MNTNSPSHESVTERAEQIWRDRGCPSGNDNEIWFEAERQLKMTASAENVPSNSHGRGNGNTQAGATSADPKIAPPTHQRITDRSSTPESHDDSVIAAQQKKVARAPKQPTKSAPKVKPPESGKPVWSKPHSS